jgi:hypothetical protein
MLEMIDEPVRVAHDCGFPPFAEVKDGKSEDWPSIFFAPLPRGRASM